jgi:hypothetical protein
VADFGSGSFFKDVREWMMVVMMMRWRRRFGFGFGLVVFNGKRQLTSSKLLLPLGKREGWWWLPLACRV